jgi:hypothetical protein
LMNSDHAVRSVDINPVVLLAEGQGAIAVDATIITATAGTPLSHATKNSANPRCLRHFLS